MSRLNGFEIIQRTRAHRLKLLAKRIGSVGKLARAVGKVAPSLYRTKVDKASGRILGEKLAREVEEALGLALLWLDGVGHEDDPWGEKPDRPFVVHRKP